MVSATPVAWKSVSAASKLIKGLAVDTLGRGRPSFEAADTDFHATGVAETIILGVDTLESLIDFLDQLPLPVPGAEFNAEFLFLTCAVSWVGEVCRLVLQVMHGPIDFFHEFLSPVQKDLAKVLELAGIHVFLALSKLIRREVLEDGWFGFTSPCRH